MNHPFGGTPIYGNPHMVPANTQAPRGFLKPTHPLCLAKCGPHAGSPSNWCPRLASASSALQRDSPEEICTKTTCSVFWNMSTAKEFYGATFSNYNIIIYIYIYNNIYILYYIYISTVQHEIIPKLHHHHYPSSIRIFY